MKRIIILSIMLFSIHCIFEALEECNEEKDQSKCQKHTIEKKYNYLSCFKVEGLDYGQVCGPFFTSEKAQKTYMKYYKGLTKERVSVFKAEDKDVNYEDEIKNITVPILEKDFYSKNEIIKYKEVPFNDLLTEKDKKILDSNNTCTYHYAARFLENYPGVRKLNISDKTVCFNVDRFEDLKDISDCGYATIKAKYEDRIFVFTNCFNILDKNANEDFKNFYEEILFNELYQEYYKDVILEFTVLARENPELSDKSKSLQLQEEPIDFEMYVEDRHGNIVHYNKNGEKTDGDDPTKFLKSNSNYSFNIILLLFYILLLI